MKSVRFRWIDLIALVLTGLAVFLIGYPRLKYPIVGGDTFSYISAVNVSSKRGFEWFFWFNETPLSWWIYTLLKNILNISALDLFKFVPVLWGILHMTGIYIFTKNAVYRSVRNELIIYSLFFAAISTTGLRLSTDLFNSFLSLGLTYIFLTTYFLDIETHKKRFLAASEILLISILFVYWYNFILLMAVLGLFVLLSLKRREIKQILYTTVMTSLPAILIICIMFFLAYLNPTTFTLGRKILSPFTVLEYPAQATITPPAWMPLYGLQKLAGDLIADQGNVIPFLFSLIGIPSIVNLKSQLSVQTKTVYTYAREIPRAVLFSWIAVLSFLMFLPMRGGLVGRIGMLFPIPILSAYGLKNCLLIVEKFVKRIIGTVSHIVGKRITKALKIFIFVWILIVSTNVAIDYQNRFAVSPVKISDAGLRELLWLKEHYGVTNESIVYVTKEYRGYKEYMAALLSPQHIYVGHVLNLLSNRIESDDFINHHWSGYVGSIQNLQAYDVLENLEKYTIIVTEHTYGPDEIEKQFLQEVDTGIYVVPKLEKKEILDWFTTWSLSMNESIDIDEYYRKRNLQNSYFISNCDILTDWTNTPSRVREHSVLATDTSDKKEGNASVKWTLSNFTGDAYLVYNPLGTWNFSRKEYLILWMKTNDTRIHYFVYLYDIDGNYRRWHVRPKLSEDTWTVLILRLTAPDTEKIEGKFDLSEVQSLAIRTYQHPEPYSITVSVDDLAAADVRLIHDVINLEDSIPDFTTFHISLQLILFFVVCLMSFEVGAIIWYLRTKNTLKLSNNELYKR